MVEYLAGNRIRGTNSDRVIATGGTVTVSGTKTIHSFLLADTGTNFTPTSSFNVEYLVVAGGGGAGGYLTNFGGTALGVTAQSYPITVGAGGVGSDGGGSLKADNGTNSVFSSITSIGGGGGGGVTNGDDGGNGGSGGGAGANNNDSVTFGTGTASQGYNGGAAAATSSPYSSGGGGGSSEVGYNNNGNTVAGNGGDGTASSITGSSITRAGGGGGSLYEGSPAGTVGVGGSGGGGSGSGTVGGNGTANTGSGAGGGRTSQNGGTGGSGVVIISYTSPLNIVDGSIFYETDNNKSYVLYDGTWSEV